MAMPKEGFDGFLSAPAPSLSSFGQGGPSVATLRRERTALRLGAPSQSPSHAPVDKPGQASPGQWTNGGLEGMEADLRAALSTSARASNGAGSARLPGIHPHQQAGSISARPEHYGMKARSSSELSPLVSPSAGEMGQIEAMGLERSTGARLAGQKPLSTGWEGGYREPSPIHSARVGSGLADPRLGHYVDDDDGTRSSVSGAYHADTGPAAYDDPSWQHQALNAAAAAAETRYADAPASGYADTPASGYADAPASGYAGSSAYAGDGNGGIHDGEASSSYMSSNPYSRLGGASSRSMPALRQPVPESHRSIAEKSHARGSLSRTRGSGRRRKGRGGKSSSRIGYGSALPSRSGLRRSGSSRVLSSATPTHPFASSAGTRPRKKQGGNRARRTGRARTRDTQISADGKAGRDDFAGLSDFGKGLNMDDYDYDPDPRFRTRLVARGLVRPRTDHEEAVLTARGADVTSSQGGLPGGRGGRGSSSFQAPPNSRAASLNAMSDSVARGDEASRIREELIASRAAASHAAEAIRTGTLDLVGAAAGAPQHGSAQHGSAQHGSAQYGSAQYGSAQHGSAQYQHGTATGARLQPLAHSATHSHAMRESTDSIPDWGTLQPSPMGQIDPLWRGGGEADKGRMLTGGGIGSGSAGIAGSRRGRRATPSSLPSLPQSDSALSPAISPPSGSSVLPPTGPAFASTAVGPQHSGRLSGRADQVSPRIANRSLSHHAITPAHFATVTPSDLGLAMPADTRLEYSKAVPPDVQKQLALLEAEMSTAGLDGWANKMQSQSSPPQQQLPVGRYGGKEASREEHTGHGEEGGATKAVSKQLEAMRSLRERLSRVAGVSLP